MISDQIYRFLLKVYPPLFLSAVFVADWRAGLTVIQSTKSRDKALHFVVPGTFTRRISGGLARHLLGGLARLGRGLIN